MGRALSRSFPQLSDAGRAPALLLGNLPMPGASPRVGPLGQGQASWLRMGSEHGSWSCLLHPTAGMHRRCIRQRPPTAALNSISV